MPQSQTTALPRHQEEQETDKSIQAQIEQTYEKHRVTQNATITNRSPSQTPRGTGNRQIEQTYEKHKD